MSTFTSDYYSKCALSGLEFEFLNKSAIYKLSVKEIQNPFSLDKLLNPVPNGLYDLALGPIDKNDVCLTCCLDFFKCPGHYGHIDLVLPVYNPIFFKDLVKFLRSSCFSCHMLLPSALQKDYFNARMQLLDHNLLHKMYRVDELYLKICHSSGDNTRLIDTACYGEHFRTLVAQILADEDQQEAVTKDDLEPNRNVCEAKLELVKEFMNESLKTGRQTCPHCGERLSQLRAELNSKIFLRRAATKGSMTASREKKQQQEKQQQARDRDRRVVQMRNSQGDATTEEEVPDDMEKAMDGLVVEDNDDDDDDNQQDENINSPKESTSLEGLSNNKIREEFKSTGDQVYLTPVEVQKHLRLLVENERKTMANLLGKSVNILNDDQEEDRENNTTRDDLSDMFFFECVAVAPSRFRPISTLKDQKFENARTTQLSKLIQDNMALKEALVEMTSGENGVNDAESSKTQSQKALETLLSSSKKFGQKKIAGANKIERVQNAWLQVQQSANLLYDAELDKLNRERATDGLKQVLEKKEGLFRKHMMGKRVNFAGRSVISPDVYIGTDEIGIPEIFAKKLTYPQPVNAFNYWEMRQAVLNGPSVHPGATMVEFGNGHLVRLRANDPQGRAAIAKQLLTPESSVNPNLDIKIVHRHMKNGDILLFNRQPTLHRPSIMAHKARILPREKTLRMHYSNCKSYNADFDGDEMNVHLPQNELARSEALDLVISSNHYLVPKDGTPLGGLIHDHVVGGTTLTCRDRFFDRVDYQALVYQSLHNALIPNVRLLPPAILKPKPLWTGKQVVTTMLINLLPFDQKGGLNLEGKAKVPSKSWISSEKERSNTTTDEYLNDSYVLIRNGHLLNGVLDKAHYGSSSYSLVHCCYELYGPSLAGQLLTCFGRLFTAFIQRRGFTLGVEDILLRANVHKPMQKIRKRVSKCGLECLAKVCRPTSETSSDELIEQYKRMHQSPDESLMQEVDLAYKGSVDKFQNELTQICFPNGLVKRFPENNLQLMIQSGAKGSSVNSMQMSCLLGQQELEGRRPRLMVNGNTLPSFLPYDPAPTSGGFICNSFMSGLTPQEYFFHCMAGREGLVDTAVKTSRSGYLQRCLIKHLEGLVVNYDLTVRDSDSCLIQFQYGEDSLAIEKTPFLNDKQLSFLAENSHILLSNAAETEQIRAKCSSKRVRKETDKVRTWKKDLEVREKSWRTRYRNDQDDCNLFRWSPFLDFSSQIISSGDKSLVTKDFDERVQHIKDEWRNLDADEMGLFISGCPVKCRLPVTSTYAANRYLGAISEKLEQTMESYLKKNGSRLNHLTQDEFKELFHLKCIGSCISPGDSVGILAAQSIGEPSTQMTLNTFHFAGRGDMNVTLGIPRLREILMVASNQIKTPSMQVPVRDGRLGDAERIKLRLTPTNLWQCVSRVEIEQTLQLNYGETMAAKRRVWLTSVRVDMLSQHELTYSLGSPLTLADLLAYVETKFIKNLCVAINKKYNQIAASGLLHASKVMDKSMKNFKNINQSDEGEGVTTGATTGDMDNDDDEIIGDTDAGESMGAKMQQRKNDELEYEEEEEVEESERAIKSTIVVVDEDDDDVGDADGLDENEQRVVTENGQSSEILDDSLVVLTTRSSKESSSKKMSKQRVKRVIEISDLIESYSYDFEHHRWFSVSFKLDVDKPRLDVYSIVQKEAKHSSISKVSGVKRCFLNQSTAPGDNGCFKLITEGINIEEVIKNCSVFDTSKLYLNDIHMMAAKFGIEAASKVLINEIKQVFGVYGIHVDYRHLSLIADYMTYEGVYKPFNRIGIKSNSSPLQKMSFETCMQFFKDAFLYNQKETVKSPSACLITGRLVNVGSGLCEVLTKLVTT